MPEVQKISMDEFISEYKPIKNDNGGWTHKSAEASQMLPIFVWTLVDSIWSVAPVAVHCSTRALALAHQEEAAAGVAAAAAAGGGEGGGAAAAAAAAGGAAEWS